MAAKFLSRENARTFFVTGAVTTELLAAYTLPFVILTNKFSVAVGGSLSGERILDISVGLGTANLVIAVIVLACAGHKQFSETS